MATDLVTIAEAKLKVRYLETYVSEGLNVQNTAHPAGILYGFSISTPSAENIRFSTDSLIGASVARVRTGTYSVTYREPTTVTIDLAAHAGTTVYIGVVVSYSTSAATTGKYRAYSSAEYTAGVSGVIWLCSVAVPSSGSLAASDVDTSCRSRSWAETTDAPDLIAWMPVMIDPLLVSSDQIGSQITATGHAISSVTTTVDQAVHSVRLYLTGGTAGNVTRLLRGVGATKPLGKVRLRFRLKATACTATEAGLVIRWRDDTFVVTTTEVVGIALSATTQDFTDYLIEVSSPVGAYYFEVGVGATSLSAGTCYIEGVQAYVEKATPTIRGDNLKSVEAPQVVLVGEHTASNRTRIVYTGQDALSILPDTETTVHVGGSSNPAHVEVHGDSAADTFTYRTAQIRYEMVNFSSIYGFTSWRTSSRMTVSNDSTGLTFWPTLESNFTSGDTKFDYSFGHIFKPGETLVDVVLGVDDATDADAEWEIEISLINDEGTITSTITSGPLTRTGSANIRKVAWSDIALQRASGEFVWLLTVTQTNASVSHHHYWIKFKISTESVQAGLGIEP